MCTVSTLGCHCGCSHHHDSLGHGDSYTFQKHLGASHVRFHFYLKEIHALSEFDVHRGSLSEEKNMCVLPIVSNNFF